MHCSQMASIRENDSELMNETLRRFANMKGSPEKLLHSADVAILIIADENSRKDACGMAYPDTGFPFSVVLYVCSLIQNTFSHEIAHNFGVEHSSGYVFKNKKYTNAGEPASKYEEGKYFRTIMAKVGGDMIDETIRINYFSNPNIIHPITKLPIGKLENPDNIAHFAHFAKNISFIAANGDESCKCHDSCNSKSNVKPGKGKAKHNLKKRYDMRQPGPPPSNQKQNLFKKYLTDLQKLYQNYYKDDQLLYKNYLHNAHKKIHGMK